MMMKSYVQMTYHKVYGWDYSKDVMNYYGYQVFDNDKDVMNFEKITNDYWNDSKHFSVEAPQTFTMPAHNVIFTESPR